MFKVKTTVWGLIGLLLMFLPTIAGATVIYEQSLSGGDNYGFVSNIDGDLSADNFEITSTSFIQAVSWYGMYYSANVDTTDTFDIQILTLAGDILYNDLDIDTAVKTDSGSSDSYGETIYLYEVSIADWELSAGSYLLSISNTNSDYSDWYWADGLGGDGTSYYSDSGVWLSESYDIDMAFALEGEIQQSAPVPEPSTVILLGLGSVLMIMRTRLKQS